MYHLLVITPRARARDKVIGCVVVVVVVVVSTKIAISRDIEVFFLINLCSIIHFLTTATGLPMIREDLCVFILES